MWFIYIAPYAWRQRRFLLSIYIALLPKGACGSAGWVSNTTNYNCCHYRRMQERNPFGQPACISVVFKAGKISIQKIYSKLVKIFFTFSFSLKDSQLEITSENQQALQEALLSNPAFPLLFFTIRRIYIHLHRRIRNVNKKRKTPVKLNKLTTHI